MTRAAMVVGFLLGLGTFDGPVAAQDTTAPVAVLRLAIDGEGPFVRGQRLDLLVEALTSVSLDRAPLLPAPEGDGLVVLGPVDRPTPISDRIDGGELDGFRWRFAVFPVRSGDRTIAPLTVDIAGAVMATEPLQLSSTVPDDLRHIPDYAVSTDLSVEQTVLPRDLTVAVGDAITREVTITADDAVAMMLPALEPTPIPGMRVYAGTPDLADRSSRGRITATRTDQLVYVIQHAGSYTLPAVELAWWDIDAGRVRMAVAEAVTFEVADGLMSGGDGTTATTQAGAWRKLLAGGVAGLMAIIAILATVSRSRLRCWRSVRGRNRDLRRALSDGDPKIAVAGVYRYLSAASGTSSLTAFLDQRSDQAFRRQIETLLADAYSGHRAPWSGDLIYRGLLLRQATATLPAADAETDRQLNPVASPSGSAVAGRFASARQTLPDW